MYTDPGAPGVALIAILGARSEQSRSESYSRLVSPLSQTNMYRLIAILK